MLFAAEGPKRAARIAASFAATKSRDWRASNSWSGRRESNPRPTAWKAVTLPLSYSRLKTSCQLSAVSLQQTRFILCHTLHQNCHTVYENQLGDDETCDASLLPS